MKRKYGNDGGTDSVEGDIDHHSRELPEAILQHILSYLNEIDAAQMSRLSKAWYTAWCTRPIMNLHLNDYAFGKVRSLGDFLEPVTVEGVRQEFMNFAKKSLQRYQNHNNIPLQLLDLSMRRGCCLDPHSCSFIKELLGEVEKTGVKELRVCYTSCGHYYLFPELSTILESKELTELNVKLGKPENEYFDKKCSHQIRLTPSWMPLTQEEEDYMPQRPIKCCLLRRLFLENIYVGEAMLENINSSCPLIEILELVSCLGFGTIKVANLRNLRGLTVIARPDEHVEVKAVPSLESFHCGSIMLGTSTLKLHPCQNLKELSLQYQFVEGNSYLGNQFPNLEELSLNNFNGFESIGLLNPYHHLKKMSLENLSIGDGYFENLEHQFPNLEDLSVIHCSGFQRINISSNSLKSIYLRNIRELTERPEINAPSIVSFGYSGKYVPCFKYSFGTSSSESKCNICICDWSMHPVMSSLFIQLKEMLKKLEKFKVSLTISVRTVLEMENLRYFPHLGEPDEVKVEDLNINVVEISSSQSSSSSSDLLDNLFWTCRPKTICLYSSCHCDEKLIRFLCQRLMDRTSLEDCNSGQSSFWPNELKEVKLEIVNDGKNPGELIPDDWRILVKSSYALRHSPMKFFFRLKW